MNIQEIDRILSETPMQYLQAKLSEFSSDERTGVKKLLQKYQKKHDDYVRELERIDRMMLYERKYADYGIICGIDEAGRGPLAGPVCAAAPRLCCCSKSLPLEGKGNRRRRWMRCFPPAMTRYCIYCHCVSRNLLPICQ